MPVTGILTVFSGCYLQFVRGIFQVIKLQGGRVVILVTNRLASGEVFPFSSVESLARAG